MSETQRNEDKTIMTPHDNDVLFGRGNFVNRHVGNLNFRKLCRENKATYSKCSKLEKKSISIKIVKSIRELDPAGRFLKRNKQGQWFDVGDQEAREKTSQALRDCNPEAIEDDGSGTANTKPSTSMAGVKKRGGGHQRKQTAPGRIQTNGAISSGAHGFQFNGMDTNMFFPPMPMFMNPVHGRTMTNSYPAPSESFFKPMSANKGNASLSSFHPLSHGHKSPSKQMKNNSVGDTTEVQESWAPSISTNLPIKKDLKEDRSHMTNTDNEIASDNKVSTSSPIHVTEDSNSKLNASNSTWTHLRSNRFNTSIRRSPSTIVSRNDESASPSESIPTSRTKKHVSFLS